MRNSLIATCIALLVGALLAPAAGAAPHPGSLDRSFSGGLIQQGFGLESGAGGASRVALQPDGKAVLLVAESSMGFEYALTRLNADGSIDRGFGSGGYVNGDFGVPGSQAVEVALQPDGKILVAGRVWRPSRLAVTRYDSDGSIDLSFGDDGTALLEGPGAKTAFAGGMLLQPDGKILLTGVDPWESQDQLEVARLHGDGSLDRSYGHQGFAVIPIPKNFRNSTEQALALHEDKLTVAVAGEGGGFLVRLAPSGSIDQSFAGGSKVVAGNSRIVDLAIQPDGRILVATGPVTRLLPDGSLDTSFGAGGITSMPANVFANALSLLGDGRIQLGGALREEDGFPPLNFAFLRLTPDGGFDPGLGAGSGYVFTDVAGGLNDEALDLAPLPNGGALLVGQSDPEVNYSLFRAVSAARYEPDGSLDPSFGNGGTFYFRPLVAARDMVFDLLVDDQDRVVVTGRGAGEIATTRFLSNGTPDPAFGNGGSVTTRVSGAPLGEQGRNIVRYPDGRLLVGAGSAAGGALLRYLPDGSPDPGFGTSGTVRTPAMDNVFDLALDRQGRIVAAGVGFEPCELVLARFDSNGAPDLNFAGGAGAVQWKVAGACRAYSLAVAVAPGGRIILAGKGRHGFVSAYTSAGRRIKSFGRLPSGRSSRRLPDAVRDVEVDPAGRTLVAGALKGSFGLVRLRPDGSADPSFGRGGLLRTPLQLRSQIAEVRLQPGGKIVAAGSSRECETPTLCANFLAVVRYNRDGSLERSFGRRGVWLRRVRFSSELNALALGKRTAVVGGWALVSGEDRQFLLTRLHR